MTVRRFLNGNVYVYFGDDIDDGSIDLTNYHLVIVRNLEDASRSGPCLCVQCLALRALNFERHIKWHLARYVCDDPQAGTLFTQSLR